MSKEQAAKTESELKVIEEENKSLSAEVKLLTTGTNQLELP